MVGMENQSIIQVNSMKCKALIDSGSMISTVSDHVLDLMKPVPEVKDLDDFELSVSVAGGSKLPYIGYVEVEVQIPFLPGESFYVPMLVVPRSDYTNKVPVIVGTNILRLGMEVVHCLDDDISIPKQWDVAFSSIQDNSSGVVRSSNRRPFKLFPSSVMTISGIVKLKGDVNTETLVTENRSILSELSDQVVVCPRVVSVKGNGKQRVPVRICNITAKPVVIKPKTVLCELSGVTVVRDGFGEQTLSDGEIINESKESLKELGINVREDLPDNTKGQLKVSSSCTPAESICMSQTLEGIVDKDDPELEAFSDISWVVEQKKDEDIARALELKRAGHKPTKREIELVPHNKKERNSKCTSETNRVDDEIQIVESVKDTEDTGSVHDSSDESDSDSDYALMPFVQPGNASSISETHSGLSSRHIDETLNTSSRLTQEQSSLTTQNSDISNEVRSVPERTHVSVEQFNEPVLRRTSRQSRMPDRYGMYSSSYIFASSRGSSMSQVDCKQVNIIPGGTYDRLCSLAEKRLHNVVHPKIVYFVAGIPDICSLVRIKNEKYEESYLYTDKDHVALIKETMSDVEKRMKNIGCKVVFATITTMSFQKWNTHRRSVGKTVRLKYESDYERMQERLNSILYAVNTYIVQRNLGNGVVTPFLHAFVHKRCKSKIRYIYSMLVDGVHPTQALSASWARHMGATIEKNERNL
ncbi:unnamed protein product [Mytilus edulis]|uniref:Uncharacterized protein n=1 Tax=Mytilus edulis TaxID=6550 RepID=A0A8S3T015_MYTED|nr:unnamed protein product [Mytilus edulis]